MKQIKVLLALSEEQVDFLGFSHFKLDTTNLIQAKIHLTPSKFTILARKTISTVFLNSTYKMQLIGYKAIISKMLKNCLNHAAIAIVHV